MTAADKREAERQPRYSWLDRLFFAIATQGWSAADVQGYLPRLNRHNAAVPPEIVASLALVDGKATGLLTHVSLMVAGLGLVAPLVANNDFEVGVVVVEIGVYLLIAVGCLRCLSIFHASQFGDDSAAALLRLERELIIRRELYSLCIRAAIGFTIIVFVLLPVMFLWKPVK